METTKKIWFNGKITDWKKAQIHILTHTLHYGAGVFEGIRAYKTKKGPAVFRLDDHLKRFFYSASCVKMKIPFSQAQVKKAILDLIKINKVEECYIRPIAFFGQKMGLSPEGVEVNLAIALWPWGNYLGIKPVKVIISKAIRLHPSSVVADAKICGYYVNSIFASLEAHDKKADEAFLLDYQGNLAEGPGENIFLVKDGKLLTPEKFSILPGITRNSVIKIAKDLKIPVIEKKIKPQELKNIDEAFFTGTAAEICPIGKIDNILINKGKMGPITKTIRDLYLKIVQGEEKKYLKWLSL